MTTRNDGAQTPAPQKLNGVDVGALGQAIEAIAADGALAAFRFRADNAWVDGGENVSTIGGLYGVGSEHGAEPGALRRFTMTNDEPPVLLGRDRGANPVEYVLHALAGCLTTSLVYHAAARGIRIDEVTTRLEGDLDLRGLLGMPGAARNGYEQVRVVFDVQGDGTPEQMADLVALAQARSPVYDIVTGAVPVAVSMTDGQAVAKAA